MKTILMIGLIFTASIGYPKSGDKLIFPEISGSIQITDMF